MKPHPARFPPQLPEFFMNFLTDDGDLVADIFAGSNTTGAVAERSGRRWYAFERREDYLTASRFRFESGVEGETNGNGKAPDSDQLLLALS